jgi:NADH-quinone oxidoreductase subunit M
VTAAFTLRAIQLSFFGRAGSPSITSAAASGVIADHLEPISLPEKVGAVLLVGATVVIGLKPDLLLDWINPALRSPLLQAVLGGGAP